MRAFLSAVLVLSLPLAGCVGDQATGDQDAADPGTPATPGETVVPWGLTDCTALVWFVPAEAQAVAEQLPAGFAPEPAIGVPAGDPPPGADAYLGFEAFRCETGQGLNGPVDAMTYATVFTSVEPPNELAVDDVDGQHYYKWHVLVPDEPRRTRLQTAGVPALDGSVSLEEAAPSVWTATFELEGLGAFTMTGPIQGPATPSEGSIPFAEFTPADGGFATWTASATNVSRAGGAGTWTVPEGTWPANVLGAASGTAGYDLDLWSFHEASIRLPPSPRP